MALQRFFKQQNSTAKEQPSEEKRASAKEKSAKKISGAAGKEKQPAMIGNQHIRVIKKPHITEKAVNLGSQSQYVFQIYSEATKQQVRDTIEQLYNVTVEQVRVVRIPAKRVRFRGREGKKKGYKKAIVTIQEGQKIDILPT